MQTSGSLQAGAQARLEVSHSVIPGHLTEIPIWDIKLCPL